MASAAHPRSFIRSFVRPIVHSFTVRSAELGGGVTAIEQTQARPRGTRLPRRARREQLLGAAQEVFVAQGYHSAAMDDIAERAGVSKPVLYQHFPGKLELYLALLDQHCEALLQSVRGALESTTDNKKRVEATMDAYFAYVEDEGGAFRLVFESDLTNEPAVRERVDKVALQCAEAISEVIAEDTGLARDQSMLLAVGLGGVSQVVARYWLASRSEVPRETAVQLLTSLAWRGIAGFPLHGAEGHHGSGEGQKG
jgi:AcrR family transcriptional regulator